MITKSGTDEGHIIQIVVAYIAANPAVMGEISEENFDL